MIRLLINKLVFLTLFFTIFSCSSIPTNTSNSCDIFSERYFWYKHAKKAEKKWRAPIYIQLAIIKKESNFNWLAKPQRKKFFKVIPGPRLSSSFGYSQAIRGTWKQYKKETGNKFATRARFKDSVDFIGWYMNKTSKLLKIPLTDAYGQYLAYYLGWNDFKNKNYKNNQKAIILAKNVQKQAKVYRTQLNLCQKNLSRKKYIIY